MDLLKSEQKQQSHSPFAAPPPRHPQVCNVPQMQHMQQYADQTPPLPAKVNGDLTPLPSVSPFQENVLFKAAVNRDFSALDYKKRSLSNVNCNNVNIESFTANDRTPQKKRSSIFDEATPIRKSQTFAPEPNPATATNAFTNQNAVDREERELFGFNVGHIKSVKALSGVESKSILRPGVPQYQPIYQQ